MSRESLKAVSEWTEWYNEHFAYMNREGMDPLKAMKFNLKMIQGLLTVCIEQERAIQNLEGRPKTPGIILPKGFIR